MSVEKTEVHKVWFVAASLCWDKHQNLELQTSSAPSRPTSQCNDPHYSQFWLSCGPKTHITLDLWKLQLPFGWFVLFGNKNMLRMGAEGNALVSISGPRRASAWIHVALGDTSSNLGFACERPCPLPLPAFIFFLLDFLLKPDPDRVMCDCKGRGSASVLTYICTSWGFKQTKWVFIADSCFAFGP